MRRTGSSSNFSRRSRFRTSRWRIAALTAEFVARAREDQAARRLATIPGFGALNATALVAAIGTGETFRRACDLAAWLGLVPRQARTGITKRRNTHQAMLIRPRAIIEEDLD